MNDDNQEIREMLERRALEVKPPSDMPPGLSGRVRRRIALNAVGAGILVIVGLVAFAGIRSLGGGSTVRPIGSPTTSNLPSPTTPAGSTACTSGQLSAAANLGGEEQPEEDALVCGDDERAKELALELAGTVVRGRAVDAGPLASARALEGLTAVIVNVNRRYKVHAGVHISGLGGR